MAKTKKSESGGGLLEVKDLSSSGKSKHRNPDPRLPQHPARVSVIGESGSGKSNLIVNMLSEGWISYDYLVLCLKNPDQPVWENFIQKMRDTAEEHDINPEDILTVIDSVADIPSIEDLPGGDIQTVVVFDDFVTEKEAQGAIGSYWTRSRNKNVSCYYLSQSFYMTPRLVRLNSTYFILFGGMPLTEIRKLYADLAVGVDKDRFIRIYEEATKKRHDFLFVDKLNPNPLKRFRQGFDGIFQ